MSKTGTNLNRRDFLGQTGKIIAGAAFAASGVTAENSSLYA
ncbi:MAG: twin-arginine translocation signal domain-containing protein, partial [Candidatus Brocadiia bacterium]